MVIFNFIVPTREEPQLQFDRIVPEWRALAPSTFYSFYFFSIWGMNWPWEGMPYVTAKDDVARSIATTGLLTDAIVSIAGARLNRQGSVITSAVAMDAILDAGAVKFGWPVIIKDVDVLTLEGCEG